MCLSLATITMFQKYQSTSKNLINIHTSMKFSLRFLQIFGFFPLQGVTSSDWRSLKFSFYSFLTFYSSISFTVLLLFFLTVGYKIAYLDLSLSETTNLVFYISAVLSNILLFKLAKDWPLIVREWHDIELSMGSVGTHTYLKKKLKILTISFLAIATIEHILIQCYSLMETLSICESLEKALKRIYSDVFVHIFSFIEYALWKALIAHFVILRSTFSWTYIDVFIILISTAFVFQLKQFTTKVNILIKAQVRNLKLWNKLRDEHYKLLRLCSILDEKLSYIIVLSYGTNMYFVLIQLFGAMTPSPNVAGKIYYWVSLGLIIMRLLSVTLYGAAVKSEGEKVLHLLFSVPSSLYNKEIDRFIDQVVKNKIIISARNFFGISRGLVLHIAGVIVTYELVLIQFNLDLLYVDKGIEMVVSNRTCD